MIKNERGTQYLCSNEVQLISLTHQELQLHNYTNEIFPNIDLRTFSHINGTVPFVNNKCDFRLPVNGNKFYEAMMNSEQANQFDKIIKVISLGKEQFVIGSQGCGKTSLLWAIASVKYVIYMQACTRNITMWREFQYDQHLGKYGNFINLEWQIHPHLNTTQIKQLYYRELMCRLLVLYYLLSKYPDIMNPTSWLLFSVSNEHVNWFRTVNNMLINQGVMLNDIIVDEMLHRVEQLIGYYPTVMVNKIEKLDGLYDSQNFPLFNTIRDVQFNLICATVWSGAYMDRSVIPCNTCSFHYLQKSEVRSLLLSLIPSLPNVIDNNTMQLIVHKLQGRPKLLSIFMECIIDTKHESYTLKEIVTRAFKKVSEYFVTELHRDILQFKHLNLLTNRSLGALMCSAMYNVNLEATAEHTLAFTKQQNVGDGLFHNCHGEQLLIEAILHYIDLFHLKGICHSRSYKDDFRPFQLGNASFYYQMDYTIALSVYLRQDYFLRLLGFKSDLHLRYLLRLETVAQGMEYLDKVLTDKNDETFSLAPGIPIGEIIVLPPPESGADVMFVENDRGNSIITITCATTSNINPFKKIGTQYKRVRLQDQYATVKGKAKKYFNKILKKLDVEDHNGMKPDQINIVIDVPTFVNRKQTNKSKNDLIVIKEENLNVFFDHYAVDYLKQQQQKRLW